LECFCQRDRHWRVFGKRFLPNWPKAIPDGVGNSFVKNCDTSDTMLHQAMNYSCSDRAATYDCNRFRFQF